MSYIKNYLQIPKYFAKIPIFKTKPIAHQRKTHYSKTNPTYNKTPKLITTYKQLICPIFKQQQHRPHAKIKKIPTINPHKQNKTQKLKTKNTKTAYKKPTKLLKTSSKLNTNQLQKT